MKYVVVIEKGEKNYGAYVPDLPGCVAVGDTVDQVKIFEVHDAFVTRPWQRPVRRCVR